MRHPYASAEYAASFTARYRLIDHCGWSTYLIERPILGTERTDAAGLYPMTPIDQAADLPGGLRRLRDAGFVSVVFVADPLSAPNPAQLGKAFSVCRPFKTHHLVVPDRPLTFSRSVKEKIYAAQSSCTIRFCAMSDCFEDWMRLFTVLVARHAIEGIAAFSRTAFLAMEKTPGLFAAVAESRGEVVAVTLWVAFRDNLYFHLAASSALGYKLMASFGLVGAVIDQYRTSTISLGGCAGLGDDPQDGLWKFKHGFANATATAMLCGAVLDEKEYDALTVGSAVEFFPAYRTPTR